MTDQEGTGREFEELIERRTGETFDGECHLNEVEARAVLALVRAARTVFIGLNARIDAAGQGSVPMFAGMAELNDALRSFEPEEVES